MEIDWLREDTGTGLGVLLNELRLLDDPKRGELILTKGRTGGATREDDTGSGDGAGDNGAREDFLKDERSCENNGVAAGLGVELNDDPTVEFKNPVVDVPAFVFCVSGTKTDDRGVDIYLMKNFI